MKPPKYKINDVVRFMKTNPLKILQGTIRKVYYPDENDLFDKYSYIIVTDNQCIYLVLERDIEELLIRH